MEYENYVNSISSNTMFYGSAKRKSFPTAPDLNEPSDPPPLRLRLFMENGSESKVSTRWPMSSGQCWRCH